MSHIALVAISIISLLVAALSLYRTVRLKRELEVIQDEAASIRKHIGLSIERLKKDLTQSLSAEMRRQSGGGYFHKDMTIGEALRLHPLAQTVMASFHLGGCSSCDIREDHILGDAARDYGIDLGALLDALNGLFDGTTKAQTPNSQEVRLINFIKDR
jgi:hybrid cluster-associated redox disulfide protein